MYILNACVWWCVCGERWETLETVNFSKFLSGEYLISHSRRDLGFELGTKHLSSYELLP